MTADSLGELLDQLEGVVDGLPARPWRDLAIDADGAAYAVFADGYPHDLSYDDLRRIVAAVNLLTPLVEVARAANRPHTLVVCGWEEWDASDKFVGCDRFATWALYDYESTSWRCRDHALATPYWWNSDEAGEYQSDYEEVAESVALADALATLSSALSLALEEKK